MNGSSDNCTLVYMKSILKFLVPISLLLLLTATKIDWGFFGHRTINEFACYTLPQELFAFYKPNIKYVREHAVDPDMRRYALKKEAGRHYIDIDYWGVAPFEILPRKWPQAFNKMLHLQYVDLSNDTLLLKPCRIEGNASMDSFFFEKIKWNYFGDEWSISCEDIVRFYPEITDCTSVIAHDSLTDYGILPYGLMYSYDQLVRSFDNKDTRRILKTSADLGHYVGDAHVPLHTTINYNGQLTDQDGIHAFWESRLPELYALENYDFLVGQAEYIPNMNEYVWDIVLDTHTYLDSVLLVEKRLRKTFPSDRQNCFEQRLERTVRIECEEFAAAYHEALDGMVERQMVKSISSLGNIWYSAWIDAGQPVLTDVAFGTIEVQVDSIDVRFDGTEVHH